MSKQLIGKIVFYSTMLFGGIIIIYGDRFIRSMVESSEEILITRLKYLLSFFVFAFFFPIGTIAREYLLLEHVKSRMKVKVLVALIVLIIGMMLWFIVQTAFVAQLLMYASLISLAYILIPTITYGKK